MDKSKSPAVSVIIPMYNTKKYITQCLESVAGQTFKDYEVIVIDDCSTDNSVAIVESLASTFEGRLQLIKLKKNNGSPGIPRNKGLKQAKGKYIIFLDSDDMFIDTALEELFNIAEKTQADVLHANRFITTKDKSEEFTADTEIELDSWEDYLPVKETVAISDNLSERIKIFSNKGVIWSCWNKFFRRDFLITNKIEFATITYSEDMPFCFKALCLAKKYVRIPNVFYMYRYRQGSIQHRNVTAEQLIKMYLEVLIEGTKVFDEFMSKVSFFNEEDNLEYRYMVIDFFIREHLEYFEEVYEKYPVYLIDVLVREKLTPIFGHNAAFISYIFNAANLGSRVK
ncbi:MAG: glycosyltransferase family 2 protein [Selenomonadaceae bacterium]|nr:glycosyltransferase family 2 protein [Selenomonadaceae bacterium]